MTEYDVMFCADAALDWLEARPQYIVSAWLDSGLVKEEQYIAEGKTALLQLARKAKLSIDAKEAYKLRKKIGPWSIQDQVRVENTEILLGKRVYWDKETAAKQNGKEINEILKEWAGDINIEDVLKRTDEEKEHLRKLEELAELEKKAKAEVKRSARVQKISQQALTKAYVKSFETDAASTSTPSSKAAASSASAPQSAPCVDNFFEAPKKSKEVAKLIELRVKVPFKANGKSKSMPVYSLDTGKGKPRYNEGHLPFANENGVAAQKMKTWLQKQNSSPKFFFEELSKSEWVIEWALESIYKRAQYIESKKSASVKKLGPSLADQAKAKASDKSKGK